MPKREKPLPEGFWEDHQWMIDHYDDLSQQYADEWVSVIEGRVVASGDNIGEVKKAAMNKTGKRHIPVIFVEKGVHIYANFTRI